MTAFRSVNNIKDNNYNNDNLYYSNISFCIWKVVEDDASCGSVKSLKFFVKEKNENYVVLKILFEKFKN